MRIINYDGRKFRSADNSDSGDVGENTIFSYHQEGDLVWATYQGGAVRFGNLVAVADEQGCLDMRYQHVSTDGQLKTGICHSKPEFLANGLLRVHESWQWTCGAWEKGQSVIEEIPNKGLG